MKTPIRTLIVDDSAFVRKVVKEMLSRSPSMQVVGTARDGREALELIEELKPDVVTCDLLMPGMDGVQFVREQMARRRLPILILTAMPEDGEKALEALDAGAVDVVQKPTALASDQLLGLQNELIEKVTMAAEALPRAFDLAVSAPVPVPTPPAPGTTRTKIVVIGISTGGPQALRYLLPQLPGDFPVPIAIVLHMPVGYTRLFAEKLNELSHLQVSEACPGVTLAAGRVVLARAGRHLLMRRTGPDTVVTELSIAPVETLHRPAADVLFQSAAECYGQGVMGIVMTGMGDDGKRGAAWIKSHGGTILTEAEESCVIFGMPRSVIEAGLSDASVPLDRMAATIIKRL